MYEIKKTQGCLLGILLEQMVGRWHSLLAGEAKERNEFRNSEGEFRAEDFKMESQQHTDNRVMGLDEILADHSSTPWTLFWPWQVQFQCTCHWRGEIDLTGVGWGYKVR